MRSFEPHQIIVEYAGEIITQQECERRMKQVYKKDKVNLLVQVDLTTKLTQAVLLPHELRQQDDYRCDPRNHCALRQSFL